MWGHYPTVRREGEHFPTKRGVKGAFRDMFLNTSAEVSVSHRERRVFFEDFLKRVFQAFGTRVPINDNAPDMRLYDLIHSFYSDRHISAMHTGHVRDVYDCTT